ncbi:hypothetical protein V2W30_04920 [Streptomyces sp. Q6]|uniref:Uncharacterized protein n=1 Tax=Streptomyces citrinus TaxID=3118173 RepID=A0ACD5AA49_9ACTN
MHDTNLDEVERPYDGCGKCLLGVRRLSRMKAATSSPERQREDILTAAGQPPAQARPHPAREVMRICEIGQDAIP